MRQRKCPFCQGVFTPSTFHPNQVVCSAPACQRQRRVEYHRQHRKTDPGYQAQCADSQRKWLDANPDYMREYRRKRRIPPKVSVQAIEAAIDLREIVKNTLALDARKCSAEVWFLCGSRRVKNIFAHAQLIVINTVVPRSSANTRLKEHPSGSSNSGAL